MRTEKLLSKINHISVNLKIIKQDVKKQGTLGVLRLFVSDLIGNRTFFEWCYLVVLIAIPLLVSWTSPDSTLIGHVTSVTGVICVVLVTEGRASNYLFGLINSIIYFILSLERAFYGELITTLYFTIMQPIGLYKWLTENKHKTEKQDFISKRLTLLGWIKAISLAVATWLSMGFAYQSVGSCRPFRDAVTDGTNVTGQMLMTGVYAEQWLFWLATNVFSIYLWWGESIDVVGMYLVYLVNSCYGWYKWNKEVNLGQSVEMQKS